MEESLMHLKEVFGLKDVNAKAYSGLALAFIGDDVYDLLIRTILISEGNMPVQKLHKRASNLVKAKTQSAMMQYILPELTEEELAAFKRGRNANPHSVAKNASYNDYRRATGFEALIGYLFLNKNMRRAIDLMEIGLRGVNNEKE